MVVQQAPGVCSHWDLQVYTPTSGVFFIYRFWSGIHLFILPNHFSSSLSKNFFSLSIAKSQCRGIFRLCVPFSHTISPLVPGQAGFQHLPDSLANPSSCIPFCLICQSRPLVPWAQSAQLPLSYLGRKTQQWCLVHFKKFIVSSLKWTLNAAQQALHFSPMASIP